MSTLSDTPTPTILTEPGGVSIKIEQGVLCENNHEYEGSRYNTDIRDTASVKYESILPTATENNTNGMSEDKFDMLNITHSIFRPDFDIKVEPDFDIDDRHLGGETEVNTRLNSEPNNESPNTTPKIRLTPTSKLIASPSAPAIITATTTTDNKRRYACPYENCTKSYGKSSHLRSHLTWHTGIKPFVCQDPGCGKGFTRSDELNRHIRTHTGEKPFECVQCTKKFSRSDHLTKHLATHTKQLATTSGPLTKKSKIGKKIFQDNLKTLSSIAVGHNVNAEDMSFKSSNMPEIESSDLISVSSVAKQIGCRNIKQEKSENNEDLSIAMPYQEKVSPCEISPAHRPEPSTDEEFKVWVKPESVYKTDSNEFSEPNEPNDDDIMPEANLPPLLQNPTINPTFDSKEPTLLKQTTNHMSDSVYDPTRPFPCSHCTKNFKRQDDLNRHMRTHTGEKPFACNECDKRFMRSDHLKKHLKTHTRVR